VRHAPVVALIALLALTLAAVACDDDDAGTNAAATNTPQVNERTSALPPTEPPAGGETPATAEEEVTGIVGAVVAGTSTIEINQLSGADVTQVAVTSATQIRRATGGSLTLAQIRPSDRIIARGAVEGAVLTASAITIQDVLPGAQPGG